jgi:hypothetical protein
VRCVTNCCELDQSLTRFGLDDLDLHPSFRFTNVGHLSIRKRLGVVCLDQNNIAIQADKIDGLIRIGTVSEVALAAEWGHNDGSLSAEFR